MKKRLEWCLKHQNYDWSRVVFTGESFFEITRSKIRMWGKRRPIRTKSHGFKIMVWEGISSRGKTCLKLSTNTINAQRYVETLEECLIEDMNVFS